MHEDFINIFERLFCVCKCDSLFFLLFYLQVRLKGKKGWYLMWCCGEYSLYYIDYISEPHVLKMLIKEDSSGVDLKGLRGIPVRPILSAFNPFTSP